VLANEQVIARQGLAFRRRDRKARNPVYPADHRITRFSITAPERSPCVDDLLAGQHGLV